MQIIFWIESPPQNVFASTLWQNLIGRFTIIPNMGAKIIKIPYIKWTLETHPKLIYNITKKLLTSYKLQNCHQFLKTSPTPKSHKNTQSTQ